MNPTWLDRPVNRKLAELGILLLPQGTIAMKTFAGMLGRVIVAVGFSVILGCGQDEPGLAPVGGRVFYQGSPLPGGSIVFTPNPDKGGRGQVAQGEIQGDGTFRLHTGAAEGAATGWHRVTVVSVRTEDANPTPGNFAEIQSLIPTRYAAPDLSGQEGLVKPGQANVINFFLD
jgi:hypothetical protein